MSSNATGRTGRPAGADPETLARGRLYITLADHGVSVSTIALRAGMMRSEVYRMMKLVRPLAAVEAQPEAAPDREPAPPKRMSEGNMLRRAFAAIRNVRAFKGLLDAETREFWVEALIEIRTLADDGVNLTFGQPGDVYHSRDEFLSVFEGIEGAQLDKLFRHSMLVDLAAGGVAMPHRWGFRDQTAAARRTKRTRPAQNPSMYDVVMGDLSLSGESGLSPDTSGGLSPDTSGLSPDNDERLSPDSERIARAAGTDASTRDIHHLASVPATESRAPLSGESHSGLSGESPEVSGESPADVSGESPAVASLTAELKAIVSPGRPPHAKDLGAVQGWLDDGETPDTIRAVVQIRMANLMGSVPNGLAFFSNSVREARERRRGDIPAKRVAATAPVSPALVAKQQALEARLAAEEERVVATEGWLASSPDLLRKWQHARAALKTLVGEESYRMWLREMAFAGVDEGVAIMALPSAYQRDKAREGGYSYLRKMLLGPTFGIDDVEFRLMPAVSDAPVTG
jgi:hypothetical protein